MAACEQHENRLQRFARGSTGARQHVLVIHELLPHFDRSGCDVRLMQILQALQEQGHKITYLARSPAGREAYEPVLRARGIQVYSGDARHMRALGFDIDSPWDFSDLVRREQFDIAILFHWFWNVVSITEQYLPEIRRFSPHTRVVVLSDDRHGERERQMARLSGNFSDLERAEDYEQREAECYRAADVVAAITEEDSAGSRHLAAEVPVVVMPMVAELGPAGPGYDDRKDLLLLANYDNLANQDGLAWLCSEVWPLVRSRLGDVRLHLAGNNLPPAFLRPEAGIYGLGFVADVAQVLAAHRVFVSPVRFGTGIKTKNMMALAHGIPLVTTTVGAEALSLEGGQHALIADSAVEFAQAISRAYQDAELWARLAANGRTRVAAQFSPGRLVQQLERLLRMCQQITPRGNIPSMSVLRVESSYPEMLTHTPASERWNRRAYAYLREGKTCMAKQQYEEALRQLRHAFGFVRGPLPRHPFSFELLGELERCYQRIGKVDRARRCRAESETMFPKRRAASPPSTDPPDLSLIIPTYNRAGTLSRCLEALAGQTLPKRLFEVIVVDDGSNDGTDEVARQAAGLLRLRYLRQQNQGAGAARRQGVAAATGRYLLLMNDDTIANPQLLRQHLDTHRTLKGGDRAAILGEFRYPEAASKRALTRFLQTSDFLFPQRSMKTGTTYGAAHFITCNLSLPRSAVLDAGSFDARLRVAEDTDLGLRLQRAGYSVRYEPAAVAWHDHVSFTTDDLLRRADSYGDVYLYLLRKYPEWLQRLPLPVQATSLEVALTALKDHLEREHGQIEATVASLRQYDDIDFTIFSTKTLAGEPASDLILRLFARAVPAIHWHYLFAGLVRVWMKAIKEAPQPCLATKPSSAAEVRA